VRLDGRGVKLFASRTLSAKNDGRQKMSDWIGSWLIAKAGDLTRRFQGLIGSGVANSESLAEKIEEVERDVQTARGLALWGAPADWAFFAAARASNRLADLEKEVAEGERCVCCGSVDWDGGYCEGCADW